jgi:hypothetical protein
MSAVVVVRISLDALRDQALVGLLVDDDGEARADRERGDGDGRRNDDAAVLTEDDRARLEACNRPMIT